MLTAHLGKALTSAPALNSSPTPSVESLTGVPTPSVAPVPPPNHSNGDHNSDNGSHSESSSGLGSMVTNHVTNLKHNSSNQHVIVDRSSSTSSSTSMGSSGLGSSPLGGASLPLFGGAGNAHVVVNGAAVGPSMENGVHTSRLPKCSVCCASYSRPKVLHECFHSFCQGCLEKIQDHPERITCPICHHDTVLNAGGVVGLLSDVGINGMILKNNKKNDYQAAQLASEVVCAGCRDTAVARCSTCPSNLCASCLHSHQVNNCYNPHHVLSLGEFNAADAGQEDIKDFQEVVNLLHDGQNRVRDIRANMKTFESATMGLAEHFQKLRMEVNEAFSIYLVLLEDRKAEIMRELEGHYTGKRLALNSYQQRSQEMMERIYQVKEFAERLLRHSSNTEAAVFRTQIEKKLRSALAAYDSACFNFDDVCDFNFVSDFNSAQSLVRNNLGYVKSRRAANGRMNGHAHVGGPVSKQPPISRPKMNPGLSIQSDSVLFSSLMSGSSDSSGGGNNEAIANGLAQGIATMAVGSRHGDVPNGIHGECSSAAPSLVNGCTVSSSCGSSSAVAKLQMQLDHQRRQQFGHGLGFDVGGLLSKRMPGSTLGSIMNEYDSWSNGSNADGFASKLQLQQQCLFNGDNVAAAVAAYKASSEGASLLDLSNGLLNQPIYGGGAVPPSAAAKMQQTHIKRQKMIYHCKFGEFGVLEGQFTEPSGVAVNAQNDIIVADTNNHRIQIFDKDGRFKFQFGECGKRDGQLLYPNRVAAVRSSGDIIVTERSPTHQVQIYNQYGQFVRKFGANILQHPRGVCVDDQGRIIVVECKVMRVIIFDQMGNVLNKFGCSKHLEFPNGVVVNDRQEIFISDNRAHCVKVFDYEGNFLRQIGGEGLTNYPIGVGINSAGEVTIADNHNNFNLSVFSQDGHLLSALESKVKHAQCFDVALMDDGSVVLASKDYRLYIYRYIQLSPIGMC